jgi:serine/threonine protein kinase
MGDPTAEFVQALHEAGLLDNEALALFRAGLNSSQNIETVAAELIFRGALTRFQVEKLLRGSGHELLIGSYIVLERLGQGGTGEVFRAQHRTLRRQAAVKVIRSDLLGSAAAVARFYREAEAIARLHHPHIVAAYDAGRVGASVFLAMEFVQGRDLMKLVQQEGPLPWKTACDYLRQAAAGLLHAHQNGVVHRDVKPSNLIVSEVDGRVKILDLGLVRFAPQNNIASSAPTLTDSGGFIGTPDFMAPEQAVDSHRADHRADIYSLGATLYYLLSGQVLSPDRTLFEKLMRLQTVEPNPIRHLRPEVPEAVEKLLSRLMAKCPEERLQEMGEVQEMFQAVLDGRPLPSWPSRRIQKVMDGDPNLAVSTRGDRTHFNLIATLPAGTIRPQTAPTSYRSLARRGLFAVAATALGVLVLGAWGLWLLGSPTLDAVGNYSHPFPSTTSEAAPPEATPAADNWEKWVAEIRSLPPTRQLAAVSEKLKELNPGFDGTLKPVVLEGKVVAITLTSDHIRDLSPLCGLPALRQLSCRGSAPGKGSLADLRFTRSLSLTVLDIGNNPVTELTFLAGGSLEYLDCGFTRIKDLGALRHAPLRTLNVDRTEVSDLEPLTGKPLTELNCSFTKVCDLTPLAGMPLQRLQCPGTGVADVGPLSRSSLTYLDCGETQVRDLKPLKGLPLQTLGLSGCRVRDLTPLEGAPLRHLLIGGTDVSDLGPLKRSRSLSMLLCARAPIMALTPLEGLALDLLNIAECPVTEFAPLRDLAVKKLIVTLQSDEQKAVIRSLRMLEQINGKPTAQFWQDGGIAAPPNSQIVTLP